MKYTVYFEQVNQTKFEIDAETPEEALKKAKNDWQAMYSPPDWYIRDENGKWIK